MPLPTSPIHKNNPSSPEGPEEEPKFLLPGEVVHAETDAALLSATNQVSNPVEQIVATAPTLNNGPRVYQSIGHLDFEQVMRTPFTAFAHLEEDIEEITEAIQTDLADKNRSDEISEARTLGGEFMNRMKAELDATILTYINSKNKKYRGGDKQIVIARVINEILGLGPIEPLWSNPDVTEIMVNGPNSVYVEINGRLEEAKGAKFRDSTHLLNLCINILALSNRTINDANAYEDGRLPDMSRVNAVHQALSPGGPLLTIRRSRNEIWTIKELVAKNALTDEIAVELVNLIHAGCSTVVVGGTGSGKALALETPIPTPTGFTTMGALQTGDQVLDARGKPTLVTAIYDQGLRPAYEVSFSDGTTVIADAEHNWLTYTRAARRSEARQANRKQQECKTLGTKEEISVLEEWLSSTSADDLISAKEIREKLPRLRNSIRHCTQQLTKTVIKRVHYYPAHELLEGLITRCKQPINTQESKRVLPEVVTTLDILNTLYTSTGHTNHAVPVVRNAVEFTGTEDSVDDPYVVGQEFIYGLRGDVISDTFLLAKEDARRQFLAGVLDVAGKLNRNSTVLSIPTTSENIANSLAILVNSLGYQAMVVNSSTSASKRYFVRFKSHDDVFRDAEKASKHRLVRHEASPTYRYITAIRPVGERLMRCITVDNDEHLYLCTTSFIPTHNTTVLNALSGAMPEHERIVTIEDNLELRLHPDRHVAPMEARPENASGKGKVTIRDLVRNSLRMRPNRIIVGECRGPEALDMLQAMNTGHEGSMTTFHANGAVEAMDRLSSMVAQSGEVDNRGALSLIASAIDVLVMIARFEDGSRRISGIYEIPNHAEIDEHTNEARLVPVPLWEFVHTDTVDGKIMGEYQKMNDLSPELIRKHRLDKRHRFTKEEAYQISDLGLSDN